MKSSTNYIKLIQNRGNALLNLNLFLKQDNGDGFAKVVKLIEKNPQLKEKIFKKLFPQQIADGFPFHLNGITFEKILLWNCHLIKMYSDYICAFSKKKDDFEKFFVASRYDEAYEICEEIKNEYGYSLWLLDAYGLLDEFSNREYDFKKGFEKQTQIHYNLLLIKNKKSERQTQYINRINHLLANIGKEYSSYYKYKLFSEMPFNSTEIEQNWKSILEIESSYSLIDIYLTTIDCLQYYLKHPVKSKLIRFKQCIELISPINTSYCKVLSSLHHDVDSDYNESPNIYRYIDCIVKGEYSKVLELFTQTGFDEYNCFSAYRYAAIAALHCDLPLNVSGGTLNDEILFHTYNILRKHDIKSVRDSVEALRSIARILRSFSIHKGICVFLDATINVGIKYYFAQQMCTYNDFILVSFEFNNNIPSLLPYRILCINSNDDNNNSILFPTMFDIIENKPIARNYYKNAISKNNIESLIREEEFAKAISIFIQAYIENPFFVCNIDVEKIQEYLDKKISQEEELSLEELCYVFIDYKYKDLKSSCFLNFVDCDLLGEPLNVLKDTKYCKECVYFFLSKICSMEMLIFLYTLFETTDEAEDYRLEICKVLSEQENQYQREAKMEMAELTKNKALQQRLINVDRSRVSVDSLKIQEDAYEDIDYQIGICNAQISENLSSPGQDKYLIINPKTDAYLCMYETYAKRFCFSQSGLDTSLSTRVRHGAFENHILRIFTENSLIYNDGNNSFFEKLFEKRKISEIMKPIFQAFHDDVHNKLQYFTQHTLKVFIDEPIEGAVFDYSTKNVGEEKFDIKLLFSSLMGSLSNANEAIKMLHKFLINKTNRYLETIRTNHLVLLEKDLIGVLDDFSEKCHNYITSSSVDREIQRNISQCKTSLQSELKTLSGWFYLSECEEWEDYDFSELFDICVEITKKLFVGFDKVRINSAINTNIIYSGKTFRSNTDILSILLNNAFIHSGFYESPENLIINCSLIVDENNICFEVENNIHDAVDDIKLSDKIAHINDDYEKGVYNSLNTRQEGGMGLYKVMRILYKTMNAQNAFYISLDNHKVKVRIILPKGFVCNGEDSFSG